MESDNKLALMISSLKEEMNIISYKIDKTTTSSEIETLTTHMEEILNNLKEELSKVSETNSEIPSISKNISTVLENFGNLKEILKTLAGDDIKAIKSEIKNLSEDLSSQILVLVEKMPSAKDTEAMKDFISESLKSSENKLLDKISLGENISSQILILAEKIPSTKDAEVMKDFISESLKTSENKLLDKISNHTENMVTLTEAGNDVLASKINDQLISFSTVFEENFNDVKTKTDDLRSFINDFREKTLFSTSFLAQNKDVEENFNKLKEDFSEKHANIQNNFNELKNFMPPLLTVKEEMEKFITENGKDYEELKNNINQVLNRFFSETENLKAEIFQISEDFSHTMSAIKEVAVKADIEVLHDEIKSYAEKLDDMVQKEDLDEIKQYISSELHGVDTSELKEYIKKMYSAIQRMYKFLDEFNKTNAGFSSFSFDRGDITGKSDENADKLRKSLMNFERLMNKFEKGMGESSLYDIKEEISVLRGRFEIVTKDYRSFFESNREISSNIEALRVIMLQLSSWIDSFTEFMDMNAKGIESIKRKTSDSFDEIKTVKSQLGQVNMTVTSGMKQVLNDTTKLGTMLNGINQSVMKLSSGQEEMKTREYFQRELKSITESIRSEVSRVIARQENLENHLSELERKIEVQTISGNALIGQKQKDGELKKMIEQLMADISTVNKNVHTSIQVSKKVSDIEKQIKDLREVLMSIFTES